MDNRLATTGSGWINGAAWALLGIYLEFTRFLILVHDRWPKCPWKCRRCNYGALQARSDFAKRGTGPLDHDCYRRSSCERPGLPNDAWAKGAM
jgi:hypothetical protein